MKGLSMLTIGRAHMAITDRFSGVSLAPDEVRRLGDARGDVVRANRVRTAAAFGLNPDRVVYMRQVHGAAVRCVSAPFGSDAPSIDGMCTKSSGLALVVLVADCAPVLLADPVGGVVGCAHAGRTGTEAGVVGETIRAMADQGGEPGRMTALVGPMVCGDCYEVPLEMRNKMARAFPEAAAVTRHGTPSLDLRAALRSQLLGAGVTDIHHDRRCTVESPDLFSYRREGPTGDFAAYVWLD